MEPTKLETPPEERLAGLKSLRDQLDAPDLASDIFFRQVVQDLATFNAIEDADLAAKFGVSRSTITRWRLGVTQPHPAMRPVIFKVIKGQVERTISAIEATV